MNVGVISHRYAKAIYDYAAENHKETTLYTGMQTLLDNFQTYPEMRKVMSNPTVASDQKINLLSIASATDDACMQQAIALVVNNGRAELIENVARLYREVYRKAKGQVIVQLTTVEPASEKTKQSLISVIAQVTDSQVEFHTQTDADLIGGFVLEIEDQRLDASVKEQLRIINYEL
ncbi:MAG: F0F1 ATP synthase subunit delta [Candidatus Symbiothrix sp.]|jgi:F-type H+-transporting ATPase subunit delta|nr:F0F1 ATP synthase subunit delta [Candidatus Symbiothrix sp.]